MDIESIVAKVTREVLARTGEAGQQANPQAAAQESGADVAGTIEHSVMNPDTTSEQIVKACKEARDCLMANVCVSPYYVPLAAEYLRGSTVKVCTAIGFPHGAATTATKVAAIREAIQNGAQEVDVCMNFLAIKNRQSEEVRKDLDEIMNVARGKALVKAIYEQSLFNDEEKVLALTIAKMAGVDFIKISNALSGKKATTEDVKFVRSVIGEGIGIKIDGGIGDAKTVRELIAAGANRFGCSKSVQIIKG